MVKAPVLSPTPPISLSLSPTNEGQSTGLVEGEVEVSSAAITRGGGGGQDANGSSFPKVNITCLKEHLVMAHSESVVTAAISSESVQARGDGVTDVDVESSDETDNHRINYNKSENSDGDGHCQGSTNSNSNGGNNPSIEKTSSSTTISSTSDEYSSSNVNNQNENVIASIMPTNVVAAATVAAAATLSPITIGTSQPTLSSSPTIAPTVMTPISAQQIPPQISPPLPPPQPTAATGATATHAHATPHPPPPHHHHIFPVHVISIPQPPPGSAAAVTGAWPLMEAPIYVDSNGEPRPYCPAHSQGPGPREHRVLLQLDAGVSLPMQIAGKRKIFRGK